MATNPIYPVVSDLLPLECILSNPSIKLNGLFAGNFGANIKGAFGPKVNLGVFFQFGFFDEILVMENGEFTLPVDFPTDILSSTIQSVGDILEILNFVNGVGTGGILAEILIKEKV